ncbi:MAG: transglutaminase-like domain-containing protein [Rhodospirillales bacterium]|nr:transglutaminase-like domain-containing protein [Rhodospirillales bacterium]
MTTTGAEVKAALRRLAGAPDESIALGEAALLVGSLDCPGIDLGSYRALLEEMAAEVETLSLAGGDGLEARVEALNAVICGRHHFSGDGRGDDNLDNANLLRVIDRRRGLPVTLGILYLHLGRVQGWRMDGLNFPGHFLVRVEGDDGRRAILDPFGSGEKLDASSLRALLKAVSGNGAELEPGHYAAVPNRDILMRLQNGIKLRQLRAGQIDRALSTVETMLLYAPNHVPLWREAGLLHLRQGDLRAAIASLEQFVSRSSNTTARHRTSLLLQELRGRLH